MVCAPGSGHRILGEGLQSGAESEQSLAVLDNSVWLVHTAALDLKPDPRRRTEVTKGGRVEGVGGDEGTAWRSGYPSGLWRRKE